MPTLDEIKANKKAADQKAAAAASNLKVDPKVDPKIDPKADAKLADNSGTHKDGEGAKDPKDGPAEIGHDVVVKNSVVSEGNKDNVVTAAVVNDAVNKAPGAMAPSDQHMERVQNAAGAAMMAGNIETTDARGVPMVSNVQPRVVAEAEPSSAARTSNIETGFQVSQPKNGAAESPIAGVLAEQPLSPEVEENLMAKAKAAYEDLGLRRFHRNNGVPNEAKNRVFYAQDDEDITHLEHHAKTGRVKKLK